MLNHQSTNIILKDDTGKTWKKGNHNLGCQWIWWCGKKEQTKPFAWV